MLETQVGLISREDIIQITCSLRVRLELLKLHTHVSTYQYM